MKLFHENIFKKLLTLLQYAVAKMKKNNRFSYDVNY